MKKLMELGSRKGIAGEFGFNSLQDVIDFTPFVKEHHWMDGTNVDAVAVVATSVYGHLFALKEAEFVSDANNHIPDRESDAPTIGEQIAGKNVAGLTFIRTEVNQNYDRLDEEYIPIVPLDWGKLRRRIEDALRKTNNKAAIFHVDQTLNIKYF